MNAMHIPGFTADSSLYSSMELYRAGNYFTSVTETDKVLPQGCYLIPYTDPWGTTQWIQNCCYYDPVTGIHGCHAYKPSHVPLP